MTNQASEYDGLADSDEFGGEIILHSWERREPKSVRGTYRVWGHDGSDGLCVDYNIEADRMVFVGHKISIEVYAHQNRIKAAVRDYLAMRPDETALNRVVRALNGIRRAD